jgi:glycosyltransferase involved in cell wall biosynthesis
MKILQINNYHHIKGGSDTVYLNTGYLLEKMGDEVIYFSTANEENIQEGSNSFFIKTSDPNEGGLLSKLKRIPSFIYSSKSYNSLKRLLKSEKPDIAHLHIFYGQLTSSVLKALREEKVPIVMTVHEYRMLCPVSVLMNNNGEVCEKCAGNSYWPCVVSKCNKGNYAFSAISAMESAFRDKFFDYKEYVDHFIMVSQFIKRKHSQYFPDIENKSSILYNFQSIPKIKSDSRIEVDLVFFGRLSREKGILTLLQALVKRKWISLKIIGTGPEEAEINEFIEVNSLQNVHLLGFCKGDDLWGNISSAKFAIVPSECYENNPMTVIESFFLGVPVIGSDIGGIPELINKKNGFIFQPGKIDHLIEKIDEALNLNSQDYTLLSDNAKLFAKENFSESHHYKKLLNIYKKAMKNQSILNE